jgi:hypothetical protein
MSKASVVPAAAPAADSGPAGQVIEAGTDTSTIDRAPLDSVRGRGLDTTDDLTDALAGEDGAGTDSDTAGDSASAVDQGAVEGGEQNPAEGPADDVPMPEGFSEDAWKGLAPEARNAVHDMAMAQAQALAQERQASVSVRTERDRQINAAGTLLQNANQLLQMITDAEYRGIDWAQLSQTDPASYVQLSRQYAQRREAIQQLGARVTQAAQAIQAQRQAEYRQSLQNELATVEPRLKALMGADFNGPKFAQEAAQYLAGQGVPMEAIGRISKGYEVELIAKAMAYDRSAKAREMAARKVADAPSVEAGGRYSSGEGNASLKRARAILRNNSRSTQALADVLGSL